MVDFKNEITLCEITDEECENEYIKCDDCEFYKNYTKECEQEKENAINEVEREIITFDREVHFKLNGNVVLLKANMINTIAILPPELLNYFIDEGYCGKTSRGSDEIIDRGYTDETKRRYPHFEIYRQKKGIREPDKSIYKNGYVAAFVYEVQDQGAYSVYIVGPDDSEDIKNGNKLRD